jgi:hypothetical protein
MKSLAQLTRNAAAGAISLIVALTATAAAQELPRLQVADNKRFLTTADCQPFFWLGDPT